MFNRATRGHTPPTYLSSDHDRVNECHQWQANLRILDVDEIKTVPYVPLSHPFVERVIGTIRRECLDRRTQPAHHLDNALCGVPLRRANPPGPCYRDHY
jgi:hypothetical protein